MFCYNCGKEIKYGANFCTGCGAKIKNEATLCSEKKTLDKSEKQEYDILPVTSEDDTNNESIINNQFENSTKRKIFKFAIIIIALFISCIGGYKLVCFVKEQAAYEEAWTISATLRELGDRASGSVDANTAHFGSILSHLARAVLNPDEIINKDEGKVKNKDYLFKVLNKYYFGASLEDYTKGFAVLMFGFDYLEKDDVDYFYSGQKVNAIKLKEYVENILFKHAISLSNLLINENDTKICFNANIRIKLTEGGYIPLDNMLSELYAFVYEGKGMPTVCEDALLSEATFDDIANNIKGSFSGELVYYDDLTTCGKLVFTYLMPRYIVQFAKNEGSELWYYYFENIYNDLWNTIINDEIFSDVLE